MFSLSGKGKRKFRGAKRLTCDIPVVLYVLDLGGGIEEGAARGSNLYAEDVSSVPFSALWKGLSGFKEAWSSDVVHFDWWNFDRFSLGEGIVSFDSQLLGSFALVSPDYMNANIRFGLHFTVIDALITPAARDNYISLRFEGGGADFEGKYLRAIFLAQVLENHGFQVILERDSVSANLERTAPDASEEKLEVIGRLLAFTPLLDMTLKDLSEVGRLVALFSQKPRTFEEETQNSHFIPEPSGSTPSQTDDGHFSYRPTWITDQLAVGHAPMSYEELHSIKKQGFNAIVNLCAEYSDLCQIEKDYGFDVLYLPVPDDQAPDIEEMDKALAWLDETIYLEKKVLIHCRLGIGRTGTFLRSYFIRRGFGPELIEERLRRIHSHPTSYSQWRLLRKYGNQAERLTIREPSIEVDRAVDLSPYFEEYEELCRMADANFEKETSQSVQPPSCGKDTDACCKSLFHIQFMEAVYLRYYLNRELSRENRTAVACRAVALSRRAKDLKAHNELCLVLSPDTAASPAEDVLLAGNEEYLCPLCIGKRCILYDHRPLRCRTFGITGAQQESLLHKNAPATRLLQTFSSSRVGKDLDEISRRVFFALNGSFLEGRSLIFPVTHVLSGKYIEDYFALLSEIDKHPGSGQT